MCREEESNLKHACIHCHKLAEFSRQPEGWVCPACGTVHPLWRIVGDEMVRMAYDTLKRYPWDSAGTEIQTRLKEGDFPEADRICEGAVRKFPDQYMGYIYRALVRVVSLPLTVEEDMEGTLGRDPFSVSLTMILEIQEDLVRFLKQAPYMWYELSCSMLEHVTSMEVLCLWAAELERLPREPERWKQYAGYLKTLEDRREKLLERRISLRPKLDRQDAAAVRLMSRTVGRWQEEVLRKRLETGKEIWARECTRFREGVQPDPGSPAVTAALNLVLPDPDVLESDRVRKLKEEALDSAMDACRTGISICRTLGSAPEGELQRWDIPLQEEQFRSLLDAAQAERSRRASAS